MGPQQSTKFNIQRKNSTSFYIIFGVVSAGSKNNEKQHGRKETIENRKIIIINELQVNTNTLS